MTHLLTSLFLVILCQIFQHKLLGQNTIIYGMEYLGQPLQYNFVSFDYDSQQFDTVFRFQSDVTLTSFNSTIDPYNGRYFFGSAYYALGSGGIYTINLNNLNISATPSLGPPVPHDIEYDPFGNRILFRIPGFLKSYDLSTGITDTICNLYSTQTVIMGNTSRAYNPIDGHYLFVDQIDNESFYILIDVNSGTIIDSTFIDHGDEPNMMVFDIVTHKYYAMVHKGEIVSIDPITGNYLTIVTVPDWNSILNRQQSVFDSQRGLFIIPYYTDSFENKLVLVDVTKDSIVDNISFPLQEFNKIYGMNIPHIKRDGHHLTATYGMDYQWYLNDSMIVGANSQKYDVIKNGYYKVAVTFMDGREEFSEKEYVFVTGIAGDKNHAISLNVIPNPANGSAYLALDIFNQRDMSISIFNLSGQLVHSITNINKNKVTIDLHNLEEGVYFFHLSTEFQILGQGRFIVH